MYEKDVIRVSNQIASTILLAKISKEVFFDDIIFLKINQKKASVRNDFINKYPNLFNGNTAKYGQKAFSNTRKSRDIQTKEAITSFLASVRRNANINNFINIPNQDYVDFNNELRTATIYKAKIIKQVSKAKSTTYSRSTIYSKRERYYKSTIGYIGFAEKEILGLKQVWQIDFIIKNNLIGRQEVLLRINFDLYYQNGQIKDLDLWLTFSSSFSKIKELIFLYNVALNELNSYILRCQQSKLEVRPKRVCTYVIRKAGI